MYLLRLQNFLTQDSRLLLQLQPHSQTCKPFLCSPHCWGWETQEKPLWLLQLILPWTGKSGNTHFQLSAGRICELVRKTNFHHVHRGNFTEYNWPLNISVERPGLLKVLRQSPSQNRLCSISWVSLGYANTSQHWKAQLLTAMSLMKCTVFLQTCIYFGARGCLYLQSASHLRGPWITLQDKLPHGSQWLPVGLLPYLHVMLQLVLGSWILACEPSPAPASTLLSYPIALSCHLSATRALPGMILAPDYSPDQFGGYEQYRDHSPRGRVDEESLAMPLALRAKEEAPSHLIY